MSHRPCPPQKPSRLARLLPWVDLLAKLLTALATALALWKALAG
jgi:hypothetical protein